MEIEQLRQELNHLLESINERSNRLTGERNISPLEIDVILSKVNQLQEKLVILRYMLNNDDKSVFTREEAIESPFVNEEKLEKSVIHKEESSHSVADQLNKTTITKLADAFNLNDRYLYANELFNKDMNAFNNLIMNIDQVSSLSDAQTLVNQAKQTYSWDEEDDRVQEILNLVERKFT